MLTKFSYMEPSSSRPGVVLNQAKFSEPGEGRVPFEGGQFIVQPGATSKPDTHQVSECWMIARGEGTLNYDGEDYPVSQGDFLFFEPQKTHFITNNSDQELVIYTVWWLEK